MSDSQTNYPSQKVVGLFFGGLNAASTLSVIVVVIYGAYLTITGSMTTGSLTSFILYSLTGKSLVLFLIPFHFNSQKKLSKVMKSFIFPL